MKWIYEFRWSILVFFGVFALLVLLLGQAAGWGIRSAAQSSACQNVHVIGLALYSYGNDHQGHYPEGKSSTEIFQKLLDEKYVAEPRQFFMGLPGKVLPKSLILKPENVGYDVTGGADLQSSPELPLVYVTGYRITYSPGKGAVPLAPWTWFERFMGGPALGGLPICRVNNAITILRPDKDGSIPNFIPADFDPKGKVYRQLTP